MNLDGGGSSCMLVNGQETIKPSDGAQRSVTTAVAINRGNYRILVINQPIIIYE